MMQNLAFRLQRLTFKSRPIAGVLGSLQCVEQKPDFQQSQIHTTVTKHASKEPTQFLSHNKKKYPIQGPDEERRPAFVCHQKINIRYTPKKMEYITWLVRGMTVDEAIKQLSFVAKKGAAIVKETILEAQKLAVEEHNVEFKSNLWVAESFCTKGMVIKGVRRHAKMRIGEVRYTFCNYFVRLEEGSPPKDYYKLNYKTPEQALIDYKEKLRARAIPQSL